MYEVSTIFFTAVEGFLFLAAFISLSNRKDFLFKHFNKVVIFVAIYTVYSYLLSAIIPTGLQALPVLFVTAALLNYMFNGSFIKSLLKFFIIFLLLVFIENIAILLCYIITKMPIDMVIYDNFIVFLLTIITKIIESVAVLILYKSNISISFLIDIDYNNSNFSSIIILSSSSLSILIGLNVYILKGSDTLGLINVILYIVNLVLIIAVILMSREFSKLEMLDLASKLEKENIKQLIEFNEMVAKERHEYKNHLNTIYGLCTLNKPDACDKIKSYINNYANNGETKNIAIDSGNDYVDAIINVKFNNAIRKGINFLVDFNVPLSLAKIEEDAAVTIISNIIENALESISSIEKDDKYIKVQAYVENNTYYISISNNGPMISDANKKKIFNAGFSTKDNSSKKRGFGLSIVLSEVERSGGKITINSTEEVTEFLIALQLSTQHSVAKMAESL